MNQIFFILQQCPLPLHVKLASFWRMNQMPKSTRNKKAMPALSWTILARISFCGKPWEDGQNLTMPKVCEWFTMFRAKESLTAPRASLFWQCISCRSCYWRWFWSSSWLCWDWFFSCVFSYLTSSWENGRTMKQIRKTWASDDKIDVAR